MRTVERKITSDLLGVWEVIGFEQRNANGDLTYPLGTAISGNLIYTENGVFAVSVKSVMALDRSEASQSTGQEALTQMFLGGTFQISGDKLTHDVNVCSNSEWIGKLVEFLVDSDGERLTCHVIQVDGALVPYPSKIVAIKKLTLSNLESY